MSMHSTRLGGNALGSPAEPLLPPPAPLPSLPSAVSRRAALFGAVTVASVTAAVGRPAQSHADVPSPDAALIDLARNVEALATREREAWDRHSEAEDAAFTAIPPAPVRREVPGPYAGLDALSPEQRLAKLFADPNDFWQASAAVDAEHHTALAEHARGGEAIEKRHSVPRLEREARRLSNHLTAASERLAEMQAASPTGLAAKARVLRAVGSRDWMSRPAEFERHGALLESLLEDAARLGAGVLS